MARKNTTTKTAPKTTKKVTGRRISSKTLTIAGLPIEGTNPASAIVDAIASYQPQLMQNPGLACYQFWTLTVNLDNNTAVLICRKDSDKSPDVEQYIPYTDFPLPEVSLWVENGILILPCEH